MTHTASKEIRRLASRRDAAKVKIFVNYIGVGSRAM